MRAEITQATENGGADGNTPVRLQRLVVPVAVLCAQKRSIYRQIEGVEVYDQERDARKFPGGMPVIAHPPCRAWSAFCAQQAKPEPGEKELGIFCAEKVRECGGILEQPAHSRLWDAAKLPKPGWTSRRDSWAISVSQSWWGYPTIKNTWLYFSQISPLDVTYPFRLHPHGFDRRRFAVMSHNQRSATTLAFAVWLVDKARRSGHNAELSDDRPGRSLQ